ncbi:rod shape-determining protein RodA [Blochmannia endosymbiont of Camponotus (Colobopsis) obliquus]|uniref:rod shape-determining protein RodA n=1 Tax=Blochmannia endosymbiont of Camponotus (Colobopsis) obliquus TaxID=1505597 RepID=UPI00061A78C5|nr:rod shape-determining protein RodA [Blochmannia endosymbiont of Camponotus (Colobopsis) obliquus]AKC60474.1 rod shape-determining protein RodA [Blochmannia endosymbiont of Camponotus (Colobopsis) obliquus]
MNYDVCKKIHNKLHLDVILLFLIFLLLVYSSFILWSASGQNFDMMKHKIIQIIFGSLIMLGLAQIPPRMYESWSPYLYIICILLLFSVNLCGEVSKGAQRWLNIGLIRFQPSEIAKIAVPLIIARHINRNYYPPSCKNIIIAIILIGIPTIFVAIEPDLGTAIIIATSGLFVLFLSGMHWKMILTILLIIILFIPMLWLFVMHEYQKYRIKILFNPEIDPLGLGYNIIQSKIAIGSGGLTGKGWLHGTQSQLAFLPEGHTDFIFSVIGEELGLIGVLILLLIYLKIIIRGLFIATQAQNTFGRVITGSFILILFVYVFINISMVTGILPIVGIPLPLVSYGGSSLVVLMASFGIIMSIHTHRNMLSTNI